MGSVILDVGFVSVSSMLIGGILTHVYDVMHAATVRKRHESHIG